MPVFNLVLSSCSVHGRKRPVWSCGVVDWLGRPPVSPIPSPGHRQVTTVNTERFSVLASKYVNIKAPNMVIETGAGDAQTIGSGWTQDTANHKQSRATRIVRMLFLARSSAATGVFNMKTIAFKSKKSITLCSYIFILTTVLRKPWHIMWEDWMILWYRCFIKMLRRNWFRSRLLDNVVLVTKKIEKDSAKRSILVFSHQNSLLIFSHQKFSRQNSFFFKSESSCSYRAKPGRCS